LVDCRPVVVSAMLWKCSDRPRNKGLLGIGIGSVCGPLRPGYAVTPVSVMIGDGPISSAPYGGTGTFCWVLDTHIRKLASARPKFSTTTLSPVLPAYAFTAAAVGASVRGVAGLWGLPTRACRRGWREAVSALGGKMGGMPCQREVRQGR
jgi:hypothetical protein